MEEIAGAMFEVQVALDEANRGVNPLGFDADAIAFDLDPDHLMKSITAGILRYAGFLEGAAGDNRKGSSIL